MLTSSHVNKTLVLRIYLLSLPRKSEKSVKIGNRKPYENPLYGGPSWEDIRREQVGGIHLPPMRAFSRVYFPPQRGAMGLWALVPLALAVSMNAQGSLGPWPMVPMAPRGEERVLDLGGAKIQPGEAL